MDGHGYKKARRKGARFSTQREIELERRRRVALLSSADVESDPHAVKNDIGYLECRLCYTTHKTPGSYKIHVTGKRHLANLAKHEGREKRRRVAGIKETGPEMVSVTCRKCAQSVEFKKKELPETPPFYVQAVGDEKSKGLLFQFHLPMLSTSPCIPRHRVIRDAHNHPDALYLFGAAPSPREKGARNERSAESLAVFDLCVYGKRGFRIPCSALDARASFEHFDAVLSIFTVQLLFK